HLRVVAAFAQAPAPELAKCLQHGEALLAVNIPGNQHGGVDESPEPVQHSPTAVWSTERLGTVLRKASRENGESLKEPPIGLIDQVVAPHHRGFQCLLARGTRAWTTNQELEAFVDTFCELLGRQHQYARRRELQGQR